MPSPSNDHSQSHLRSRFSPAPEPDLPSSPTAYDPKPDPPPLDYPFIVLMNFVNLIGSIPMFVACFILKNETGLKQISGLVQLFTAYAVSLAVSPLLGVAASGFRLRRLVRAHVVCFMLTMVLSTIGFLLFFSRVSATTTGGHAGAVRPMVIRNVTEYSTWLREEVVEDPHLWSRVKMDLLKEKLCHDRRAGMLSPLITGCCINSCDMEQHYNATCLTWNEDPAALCYDCDSCKAAVLGEMSFRLALLVPKFIVTLLVHVSTTVVVALVSFLCLKD